MYPKSVSKTLNCANDFSQRHTHQPDSFCIGSNDLCVDSPAGPSFKCLGCAIGSGCGMVITWRNTGLGILG